MAKDKNENPPVKPIKESGGFWFVQLERYVEEGDWSKAAEAQRELKRLGWNVSREKAVQV